jgi:hypothetical protein
VNFFMKLLALKTDKSFILLYGFSGQTEQTCYPWITKRLDKNIPLYCFHTIWEENREDEFKEKIQDKSPYEINKETIFTFGLLRRTANVISNDIRNGIARPISELQIASEYWNINKGDLFRIVEHILGGNGKELFLKTCTLLSLIQNECGIDFSKNGWRFGNIEVYHRPRYYEYFSVTTSKSNDLKITSIRKRFPIEEQLIVRCASEHHGRWHEDIVKSWEEYEEIITFNAEEPMSRVQVQIWSASTGEIIFSLDRTLCMQIHISMGISGQALILTDSWTKKLYQSAPGQKSEIKQIETVNHTSNDRPIIIKSETYSEIDNAFEEGNKFFGQYRREKLKGAFIPKSGKSGEMNSFLKIKEYISDTRVNKVIIADPFFSVRAAEKFLSRIPNRQLELEIITSLTKKNPDTNQDEDAAESCKEFIHKNSTLLHHNLVVKNLHRGNEQVFHDRYLIRYLQDGTIDGFLLSNSLNSAGQFFPFVIAPLEREICLEICEYLDELTNTVKQAALPISDRITCDVLYDGHEQNTKKGTIPTNNTVEYVLGDLLKESSLSGYSFLDELQSALHTEKDTSVIRFNNADLPQVATAIKSHWPSEPMRVVEAIGEAIGHMYCWSPNDFCREFKEMESQLIEHIVTYARSIEEKQNHVRKGMDSPEYKYWAFLKGTAKVNEQGLHLLIDDLDIVLYPGVHHLSGCYMFLLHLSPERFRLLMEETSSPMMLHVLTEYMAIGEWVPDIYSSLQRSNKTWLRALAGDWLFNSFEREHMDNDKVLSILSNVAADKRLVQYYYLLSHVTFKLRVSKLDESHLNNYMKLYDQLMKSAADTLNNCINAEIDLNDNFRWLFECESASRCRLYINMAKLIKNESYKNWVLDQTIQAAHNELKYRYVKTGDEQLITFFAQAIFLRYGDDGEKHILQHMFNKPIISLAIEPYRDNYDYENWTNACNQADWQIELLKEYLKVVPSAIDIRKQLETWEPRFLSAIVVKFE